MPRVKFGTGDQSEVSAAEGGNFYDGPIPPKGIYRVTLKFLKMKTNKNGDPMLNGLVEISEPKKSKKAPYNGYGIWFNQNVTEQGAPYVNAMLDSLGIPRKSFWVKGCVVDDNDPPNVTKIGTVSPVGRVTNVNTAKREYPKGSDEWKLEIVSWLEAVGKGDEPADDDDDEPEDEDDDEQEDSDDDDEGEEDEEDF